MDSKEQKQTNQPIIDNKSNLTVSNLELFSRPCSSSPNRSFASYREADTESLFSKKTSTTIDNQDSDTENHETNENESESNGCSFENYGNSQGNDDNSNDSTSGEESLNATDLQVKLCNSEPTTQHSYNWLSESFRSYLNASSSGNFFQNFSENLLPTFEAEISLSDNSKTKPKIYQTIKSEHFQKLLSETKSFNLSNESYDSKSIHKLKNIFSNYENYYATMLIPECDNFKLDAKIDTKFCCKRIRHSSNEEIKNENDWYESEEENIDKEYFDLEANLDENSNHVKSPMNRDEFHLCSLCCHCLCEPITLICGCSYCKNCLNEYNAALEKVKSESSTDSKLTGNKRKLSNDLNDKIELFKCYNCSFVHEKNSSEFLRPNFLLSKLVDKFWSKNVDSRNLRNDLRKYVCFLIDSDFENFNLGLMEKLFLKAYELDPSNHLILADLFLLNYFDKCNPNCLKYAQSASELKPNWPFSFFMKAIYYFSTGNFSAVKENLITCLKLDPKLKILKKKMQNFSFKIDMFSSESNNYDFENNQSCSNEDNCSSSNVPKIDNTQQSVLNFDNSKYVVVNSHLVKPSELECSLCYRIFYKPVTTPCGHSFCCSCLERSLDHQINCPLCKAPLDDYLAERRSNVTQFLDKLIKNFYINEYEERQKQYYEDIKELVGDENEVPIFVCTLALPNIPCPLHIFEPRYRLMLRRAIEVGSNQFGMCMFTEETSYQFTQYGCMLEIKTSHFTQDGRAVVTSCGGRRFKVLNSSIKDGYNVAKVEWIKDIKLTSEIEIAELNLIHDDVYQLAKNWFNLMPEIQKNRFFDMFNIIELPAPEKDINTDNGPAWHWILLDILPIYSNLKYKFLAKISLRERLIMLKRLILYLLGLSRQARSNSMNSSANTVAQNPSHSGPENDHNLAANSDTNSNNGTDNSDSSSNSVSDFPNSNNNRITQNL